MKGGGELSPRVLNKFYVEMDALFMHTMSIPKKFANMFKGSMSKNIKLEGPAGITWNVTMIRSNNTFALRSGWKDFVTANKIDKNDVLLFTYNGNYSFKVEIFDSSGCEKVAPSFAKKVKTEMESEELNDSSIRVIDGPHHNVKKEIIPLSSSTSSDTESSCDISSHAARALVNRERVCCKRKQTDYIEESTESESEKAAPSFAKKVKMEMEIESEELNDSSIRVIDPPHPKVKKEIISLSSSSDSDTESSREISSSRTGQEHMTGEEVCCKRKRTDFVQESTESESESESDEGKQKAVRKRKTMENRAKKASRPYVIPRKTRLTKAQKEIANRMTQKTQKGSDLFVKILTTTNIHTYQNCILNLPDGFACKVLRSKKKKIILVPANLDKRSKICTANYCKNKSIRCIGKGWREFTRINGLKEGDFCLFELRKQDKRGILTMVVHFNH